MAGNLTDKTIIITEGVEDALSIMHVVKNVAVWASGGGHNLENFVIPPQTAAILIAADADQIGLNAAQKLAQRIQNGGLKVRIIHPTKQQGDWNDLLIAGQNNLIEQYIYQRQSTKSLNDAAYQLIISFFSGGEKEPRGKD